MRRHLKWKSIGHLLRFGFNRAGGPRVRRFQPQLERGLRFAEKRYPRLEFDAHIHAELEAAAVLPAVLTRLGVLHRERLLLDQIGIVLEIPFGDQLRSILHGLGRLQVEVDAEHLWFFEKESKVLIGVHHTLEQADVRIFMVPEVKLLSIMIVHQPERFFVVTRYDLPELIIIMSAVGEPNL